METALEQRAALLDRARTLRPLIRDLDDLMEQQRRLPEPLRRANRSRPSRKCAR